MKIVSWNVNGLKSVIQKNFLEIINQLDADFICIQEVKISKKIDFNVNGYYQYYNYSKKQGYAGVAIYAKQKPINVMLGIEIENEDGKKEDIDTESRVITAEYNEFYIVNVYVPHSQGRYNYRMNFDNNFIEYIEKLQNKKDIIICGDFNITHKRIDVCDFTHHMFLDSFNNEEKANFEELLDLGLIDTYRYMHPQMREYTFWRNNDNREIKETGWRLDYILISEYLKKNIREANILNDIRGSDHCPVELVIKI